MHRKIVFLFKIFSIINFQSALTRTFSPLVTSIPLIQKDLNGAAFTYPFLQLQNNDSILSLVNVLIVGISLQKYLKMQSIYIKLVNAKTQNTFRFHWILLVNITFIYSVSIIIMLHSYINLGTYHFPPPPPCHPPLNFLYILPWICNNTLSEASVPRTVYCMNTFLSR